MDVRMARQLLDAERNRLMLLLRGLDIELQAETGEDVAAELSQRDQHQADMATELFEREMEMSILRRVQAELREVVDALERLERGTYGTCQGCGRAIPDERLTAIPAARFCHAHELEAESRLISAPDPEDLAGREGLQHLEYLPVDDELEEAPWLSPEEAAVHAPGDRSAEEPAMADEELGGLIPHGGSEQQEEEPMGSADREWPLAIVFTEDESTTRADVVLEVSGRHYHGWGRARRAPHDPDVPRIGEEVAAARALADLSQSLLRTAEGDIEEFEDHPVHLYV